MRNTKVVDILCSNEDASRIVAIQVKSTKNELNNNSDDEQMNVL
ncbi:MAG: hypothetical protein WCJ05_01065 [bacterium]